MAAEALKAIKDIISFYPRFHRAPSVKELRDIYTPTRGDVAFASTTARGKEHY
jgi:hypothetical protein